MIEVRLDTTSYFFPDFSYGTVCSRDTIAIGFRRDSDFLRRTMDGPALLFATDIFEESSEIIARS